MQTRNLYNNAVVRQAVDKRIRNTLGDTLFVIVKSVMMDVDDRFLNVSHLMTENIHGNHRHGIAFLATGNDILFALILNAEILAEA